VKLLIDADIVAMRCSFSAEDEAEAWVACSRAEATVEEMCQALGATEKELWLSGPDNFRYGVYPEYKANRIHSKRPRWEQEVKQYMKEHMAANVSQGCEADDMLGVRQLEIDTEWLPRFDARHDIHSIICTIDKDLDMIPGWHYNFVKKVKYFVTPEEGLYNFYYQCLVGDTADGIKGVAGIGPKKAERILREALEEADDMSAPRKLYDAVLNQYGSYEHFEMTAKCLWIFRKANDVWQDPYKGT
jgi:5'-3' exonuclease